jgi:hypothetical protein
MYQPYPTGAQMPEVRRSSVPPSITNAVRIMYAGAAASVIGILIDILTVNATKSAIEKHSPSLSASQLSSEQRTLVAGFIVSGVIAAVLWILIALKCKAGRNWARLTGTILFAIATIDLLGAAIAPEAGLVKIWTLVIWLAGLGAVILLWRRSSTEFFQGLTPE